MDACPPPLASDQKTKGIGQAALTGGLVFWYMNGMTKGSLLHFDFEFTHPVPGLGQAMELGMIVQPVEFDDNGRITQASGAWMEAETLFPVSSVASVTSWVQENQADLLNRCRTMNREGETRVKCQAFVATFLRHARQAFGDRMVPCGWTLGSDMAYLLHLLGEDHWLVHYDALDISSLAFACFGRNMPDDELHRILGVEAQSSTTKHRALADARHQARLFNALISTIAAN